MSTRTMRKIGSSIGRGRRAPVPHILLRPRPQIWTGNAAARSSNGRVTAVRGSAVRRARRSRAPQRCAYSPSSSESSLPSSSPLSAAGFAAAAPLSPPAAAAAGCAPPPSWRRAPHRFPAWRRLSCRRRPPPRRRLVRHPPVRRRRAYPSCRRRARRLPVRGGRGIVVRCRRCRHAQKRQRHRRQRKCAAPASAENSRVFGHRRASLSVVAAAQRGSVR